MSASLHIRVDNDGDLALLMMFLKRLNIQVVEQQADNALAMSFLEELAMQGGIRSISNPSDWQRDMRQDKPLLGRE